MSAIDRINQKAAEAALSMEERRQRKRAAMPQIATWIDDVRQDFPEAQVTHARENGHEVGRKSPQGVVPCVVPYVFAETTRNKR